MSATATVSAADRFALCLDGLCRAVAARIAGGALAAAMIVLIWRRIARIKGKVQTLLARFQAGRLRVRRVTRSGGRGGGRRVGSPRLPLRFGWLLPLVPYEAAAFAGQMRGVLADPEVVALLAASRQARLVLKPLCRMLGIEAELLGEPGAAVSMAPVEAVKAKRVRKPRPKVDWGRIPLPRGVMAWAKREGFGKVPRA